MATELVFFLLSLQSVPEPGNRSNNDIHLVTENYPPFNIVEPTTQKVTGIAAEKVYELMRRAGEQYSVQALPWARAYRMGLEERNTCVFSTTRTAEREALFKWIGPLVHNKWVIFTNSSNPVKPASIEQIRTHRIGTYHGDAVEKYLSGLGFRTDPANFDAENPKKLIANRIDFWATGELLASYLVKQQHLLGQIRPVLEFNQTEMYLACNLQLSQKRVETMNQILRTMDKDGTAKAIENKYK